MYPKQQARVVKASNVVLSLSDQMKRETTREVLPRCAVMPIRRAAQSIGGIRDNRIVSKQHRSSNQSVPYHPPHVHSSVPHSSSES
jgi:hypothetical protein